MSLNNQVKREILKCSDANECRAVLQKELAHHKYKTIYSMNYSDYDKTEWYEQIKAYEGSFEDYIVAVTELKDNKVFKIKLIFTNFKPPKPHPLFPILNTILGKSKVYEFVNEEME